MLGGAQKAVGQRELGSTQGNASHTSQEAIAGPHHFEMNFITGPTATLPTLSFSCNAGMEGARGAVAVGATLPTLSVLIARQPQRAAPHADCAQPAGVHRNGHEDVTEK